MSKLEASEAARQAGDALSPAAALREGAAAAGRQPPEAAPPAAAGKRRRPILVAGPIVLAVLAAAGYVYWDHSAHFASTDDAFVAARQYSVAPNVSGYVSAVPVTDNQHVAAGDVIARIDDRIYRAALAQAAAQVASAKANVEVVEAQISSQQAQIESAKASLDQSEAALEFAREQATRYERLQTMGSGTVQNAQQYEAQLREQQASVRSAQAALELAQRQLGTMEAQRAVAAASLAQAEAQRDQAEINLSYTTVAAAESGNVVNLGAAVGQFVQPGASLSNFVPDAIWVVANFKETKLDAMRPGQPATLSLDAYPGRAIHGHVASIQRGSGTAFSLLPAENATGNYVKIVQRVPVKIVMDDAPADFALGPGMSVDPTVRVDPAPSLFERMTAIFGKRR